MADPSETKDNGISQSGKVCRELADGRKGATFVSMMPKVIATGLCTLVGWPALAEGVVVSIRDLSPYDIITLQNTGCALTGAVINIDLQSSAGQIVIDTEYGGIGSQNPKPVEVQRGDISVSDIQDGAQAVEITINHLGKDESAIVTFDMDDSVQPLNAGRVTASSAELAGTTIRIMRGAAMAEATLDYNATATIPFEEACQPLSMS